MRKSSSSSSLLNSSYLDVEHTADDFRMHDWRKGLRTPPTYRIGNRTFRFHYHIILLALCCSTLILIFLYTKPLSLSVYSSSSTNRWSNSLTTLQLNSYNYTYPLTVPIISDGMQTFRIGLIADLDKKSKDPNGGNKWRSYFKKGHLSYNKEKKSVVVSFDKIEPTEIDGGYALNGRGMELSELVTFNGRLLTFDDRTGLVYELIDNKVMPWVLLMDGSGKTTKGFKSEWATVKDEVLYVGSMGKEWTTDAGEFQSFDPMFVKAVTVTGEIHHLNWIDNYKAIRSPIGIEWPGYMIHESGMWSVIHRRWFFLPRRCSKERYNETRDEYMGCNVLISTDENFRKVNVVKLGEFKPTMGFSSFKFIPGSDDSVIVALQTEEIHGKTTTYIASFTTDGETLLEPVKLDTKLKYEGIEFT